MRIKKTNDEYVREAEMSSRGSVHWICGQSGTGGRKGKYSVLTPRLIAKYPVSVSTSPLRINAHLLFTSISLWICTLNSHTRSPTRQCRCLSIERQREWLEAWSLRTWSNRECARLSVRAGFICTSEMSSC